MLEIPHPCHLSLVQDSVSKHKVGNSQCWSIFIQSSLILTTETYITWYAAFDHQSLILYVSMHQPSAWLLSHFHHAHVAFTTVLHLTTERPSSDSDPSSPTSQILLPAKESQSLLHAQPRVYRIAKQEDLYQALEFVKFLPGGG